MPNSPAPSDGPAPRPEHATYFEEIRAEDDRLRATLTAICADQDDGHLSVREAADNRVGALEAHLARCRELFREHFGGDETA